MTASRTRTPEQISHSFQTDLTHLFHLEDHISICRQKLNNLAAVTMYTHNNPVAHRKHKKSTTGCKACKARKVKVQNLNPNIARSVVTMMQCDEKRPVCGKCAVHFSNIKSCDYNPPRKAAAKKLEIPVAGSNLKRIGGAANICPYPENRPSPTEIAQGFAALCSTIPSPHVPNRTELTPPTQSTESTLGQDTSSGRRCGCPCHKPGESSSPIMLRS